MLKISTQLFFIASSLKSLHLNKDIAEQLQKATQQKCSVTFEYSTIEGNTNVYNVMPLDIKLRQLKEGTELVLYAEDVNQKNRTKSFIVKNIRNIKVDKNSTYRKRKNLLTV